MTADDGETRNLPAVPGHPPAGLTEVTGVPAPRLELDTHYEVELDAGTVPVTTQPGR